MRPANISLRRGIEHQVALEKFLMLVQLQNALADVGRLMGAALYWNLRKTIYALAGRQGRAPCQSDSDDQIVGCVGCDAMVHWNNPEAFRRVCPLLQKTTKGWRCSVLAAQVRPFWGRALAWYGAAVFALYLAGVSALWLTINLAGNTSMPWWRLAWPGAWHSMAKIQADELYQQSLAAFTDGDYIKAYRTLETARMRDPYNYDAALLMAKISMFQGSYGFSDPLYEDLMQRYPERMESTAINYHDALLVLNRMPKLADLCIEMVSRDPGHTAFWVKSLLLALRETDSAEVFRDAHESEILQLPEFARMLVEARLAQSRGEVDGALRLLAEPFRGAWNLQYMQAHLALLLELKRPVIAKTMLGYYGPGLRIYESMAQEFKIDQAIGNEWEAQATFASLLRAELTPQRILRLQLLLIRSPNQSAYLSLHEKLQAEPTLKAEVDGAVMWIAGLACGAPAAAKQWQDPAKLVFKSNYPEIDRVEFKSRRIADENSVLHILNVVNFPREVIQELLACMNGSPLLPEATSGKTTLRRRTA